MGEEPNHMTALKPVSTVLSVHTILGREGDKSFVNVKNVPKCFASGLRPLSS